MVKKKTIKKGVEKPEEEVANTTEARAHARTAVLEARKANPHLDQRLETFRERFFELEGRYPNQDEIPQPLGGTRT